MFADSDSFMQHMIHVVSGIEDDFVTSRYVGFVAVSAVTIYEVNVKHLLKRFANETHPMVGIFASIHFDRINGHVTRDDIEKYIKCFGDEFVDSFKNRVDRKEEENIQDGSVKENYKNLITWRNEFVHAGNPPNQATFDEAIKAYRLGKEVVIALDETLRL